MHEIAITALYGLSLISFAESLADYHRAGKIAETSVHGGLKFLIVVLLVLN